MFDLPDLPTRQDDPEEKWFQSWLEPHRDTLRYYLSSRRGSGRLLALGLVLVALGILLYWSFRPDSKWVEPAFAFLLLAAAGVTGTEVFSVLFAARPEEPALLLERSEDLTTRPWRMTNHSVSEQRWALEVSDLRQRDLLRFWMKEYASWPAQSWPQFERLLEDTSSINYRVKRLPDGWPRLLRFHKASGMEELKCQSDVAALLERELVFQDGFGRYGHPLALKSGELRSFATGTSFGPHVLIGEVYPCARGVEHFPGRELKELGSVGRRLGKAQMALQTRDDSNAFDALTSLPRNSLLDSRALAEAHERFQDLLDLAPYSEIAQMVKTPDEYGEANTDENRISEWINEAVAFRKEAKDAIRLLLHDVHPHNVFYARGTADCVLIYDYEWLGRWPHGHVVAFSLHRFAREFVMKRAQKTRCTATMDSQSTLLDNAQRLTDFCDAAREFTKAYVGSIDRHALPLPNHLGRNLSKFVKSANIEKLLRALTTNLAGYDRQGRSSARLLGEARKFIRYMKEADELGKHEEELEEAILEATSSRSPS